MITKKEFSAVDAAPAILYAKRDANSDQAYPILVSSDGALSVKGGFYVPLHNQQVIDESDSANVVITYKYDGVTVATKTIATSGTTTTITVALV
jgi:hypothetical protein